MSLLQVYYICECGVCACKCMHVHMPKHASMLVQVLATDEQCIGGNEWLCIGLLVSLCGSVGVKWAHGWHVHRQACAEQMVIPLHLSRACDP